MSGKMKTTNVSIRLDLDLKRDAEVLFANLGMNLSTAFNIFLRQSLRAQGLPFPVKLDFSSSVGREENHEVDEEKSKND